MNADNFTFWEQAFLSCLQAGRSVEQAEKDAARALETRNRIHAESVAAQETRPRRPETEPRRGPGRPRKTTATAGEDGDISVDVEEG